jgi:hypothetical protein
MNYYIHNEMFNNFNTVPYNMNDYLFIDITIAMIEIC